MRSIVLGGAGFIGSHLVDRLLERGDEGVSVDSLLTGRRDNAERHRGNPRHAFVEHDICRPIPLQGGAGAGFHPPSPAPPDADATGRPAGPEAHSPRPPHPARPPALLAKGDSRPVNLGNPREMTLIELAETTRKVVGSGGRVRSVRPLPENDPKQRRPDITRARTLLGWEPEVELEDGLKPTAAYFRSELNL